MISWTKLLTGNPQETDHLRYSNDSDSLPRVVVWNVTAQCNLFCGHCYFEAGQRAYSDELTQEEAEALIEDLSRLKVPVLLFSGGEPLLRKDIFELGRFAKDRGMEVVLSTNGTLITKALAKQISRAGFSYVGISLDGMQEVNDRFRQSRGAFSAALTGLRFSLDAGLKVGLRFTLTGLNFRDLPEIFDLAEQESIPRLCIYHLVSTGRGGSLKKNGLSHMQTREVLELIWQKTISFSKRCLAMQVFTVDNHADGAWIYLRLKNNEPQRASLALKLLEAQGGNSSGLKIGAVDNCGNVYADQFFKNHSLGNIRQSSFSSIWQGEGNNFLQALRNRKPRLKGRCKRCRFLSICNGNFRVRAEALSGDPWAEDPACYLTNEEIFGNDEICAASSCA